MCFDSIIGYKGCDSTEFKYYLDDYGLSLLDASKVVDEKYTMVSRYWISLLKTHGKRHLGIFK